MRPDDVWNLYYSNHTEWENKSVVHYEILIGEMLVLVALPCGEGSDKPAHMHDLVRAFAPHMHKVWKLKKTP